MKSKRLLSTVLASLSAFSFSAGARRRYGVADRTGYAQGRRVNSLDLRRRRMRLGNNPGMNKAGLNSSNSFGLHGKNKGISIGKVPDMNKPVVGLSKSKEENIMQKLENAGVSRNSSESNIKKVVGIILGIGIPAAVAIVLAVKYCSGSSLDWNKDKEKIIKFITWDNEGFGSCRHDSHLNMFLNPVFVGEISKIPLKNWNKEDLKKQKDKTYGDEKKVVNSKLSLIDGVGAIQKIWNDCGNHDYISREAQFYPGKNYTFSWQFFWSDCACCCPESFGNMTSIGEAKNDKAKHPPLISSSLSIIKNHADKNIPGSFEINGTKYFVGGMVLYYYVGDNGGHAIYAHLLYDEKHNVKRVIIQDPRGEHNADKSRYVSQIKPNENLEKLLNGEEVKFSGNTKLKVLSAMMIREDKFDNYWKDKSLPLKFAERKYF